MARHARNTSPARTGSHAPARTHLDHFRTSGLFRRLSFGRGFLVECTMQNRTSVDAPFDILFVISPHSLLLDIAGPAEAFRLANLHRAKVRQPPRFRLRFTGPSQSLRTSVGLMVAELETFPTRLDSPTWIVLTGQPKAHVGDVTRATTATAQWLSRVLHRDLRAQEPSHRLITICSGALLAAHAGLLGKRECTTHHELIDALRALARDAHVLENRIFVVDGPVASSAGVAGGIDLALHLIAQECGEALAADVAKDMVVYFRRSPRDPELSPFLAQRRHTHAAVHKVQDAVSAEPERDWDTASLASVAHVTERHLLRLFVNHIGTSPMQYLQTIRLERARQSLEHGASVASAAEAAGFRSSLNLRRAWTRQWGGSPRDAQKV
jgi:transcriptional regulator GlxA family with amidase domain